jgi:N-acetylneuraminic acid mutarotase
MEQRGVGALGRWSFGFAPVLQRPNAQEYSAIKEVRKMFSRISKLFTVCIMLIVVCLVHQAEAGTWTRKADMPTARYIPGSAVVDGKIYVIGGAPVQYGATAVVEEYDPATDTWTKRADMPTIRQGLYAAAVDEIIYAIGGCEVAPGVDRDISIVEAYNPATDTWTRKADMPTARTLSAIAVVDGIIYVIGGAFDDNYLDGVNVEVLSTVEAYNPATDTWTKKADMPTARYNAAACVVDGRIYVFAGRTKWDDVESSVPTVEVYDPPTDTWTQASDMPRVRLGHSASVVAGKMYILGGWNLLRALVDVVDVYDPAADTWTTAADLPTVRGNHIAAVVDRKIYAIGGRPAPGAVILSTVEEYDPGLPVVISSVRPAGKLLETWGRIKKVQ